jgi:hypothetical protein
VAAVNGDAPDPVLADVMVRGGYKVAFELPGVHVWLRPR